MRFTVLILVFLHLGVRAQLAAPDLRCIEVFGPGNSNVKLTWIPPPDPTNQFVSYAIFTSPFINGPYTPVANSITSISTNSFVHVGSSASVQATYYYIVIKSGPTGTVSSAPSDTLKSIFLFVAPSAAAQAQQITYNNIHVSKLPSTSPTFTINKEYPANAWGVFKVTPLTTYFDTLTVCSASINYQVTLSDNSGCVSQSGIFGGIFKDIKLPNEPVIDSISVLPNGNTIVAWRVPYDKDIAKYQIQHLNNTGKRDTIDYVFGRNNTSYIYVNTGANTKAEEIYIGAIDSCGNGSTLNYTLNTMFLSTAYDRCKYKTALSWNAYLSMPNGVGVYRIYYSVNGGPYVKVGETTSTSFTHNAADPHKNLCYFIRVFSKDSKITASSNRVCFFSSQVSGPKFVYLKSASVIDKSSAGLSILLDTTASCSGINIFRSSDGQFFNQVGTLPYSGSKNYSFTDSGLETGKKSYYYKVSIIDSCGNSRLESEVSKTILLKVDNDTQEPFRRNLSWSEYQGFAGGISTYKIYRIVNDVVETRAVASTSSLITSYSDVLEEESSKGSKIEYFVKATEGSSNPYGLVGESISNPVSVYPEGLIFVPNAFAPDGVNKTWLPVTHFIDKADYHVSVFNRWGSLVFETNSDSQGWDGSNATADVYVYLIDYKNSIGEYKQIKGTVMLIR